ncbi:MAG: PAS domain S-box protein, partial [Candidatus Lokiarchaeota archaeon]|nr:PAS domain S-box protein [Candidatus Lokiarchaeota archaeon]
MEFSKDKFLQIIENIKECYFEVDLKGNITYFNNAFCELTGYSREELFGLNYKYIADEENQKKVFKGFNTVYKTGEPLTDFEYQFKNKSGKKLIGETSVYLKYDSEGNKIGFYGLFRDITKRKEEEIRFREELEQLVNIKTLELRESEEKYHQLFNKALYSIALFDLEGNIVDCNNATSNLLSTHTLKEYIGKNYREFWTYHEKDKPLIDLFNNIFTDIIKTGKTLNFEFPIHRTIGRIIWCYATASKIKIGKKEFIQLILIDISAQKEAQQRLKESEEKYRSLVENAHEGVWALDENDDTIFVNPKICKMLGYTKDEIMGKNLHLFLEAPMSELINSYRKRREKGLKDTYELEFMKKDGTILSASINAASILNGNGEFKGSFAYITDITNRKIAEQKLKESEEMYRLLAENIHDIIVGLDKKFQIEYINEEVVKKVLGTAKKYVLGKNVLDFVHPDDKAVGLNSLVKGIKDKEGIMEVRIRHQKGHYIWFEVKGKAFLNNKGELKGILIARNITERKHAEEKLRESEEQYRTLVETMTDGLVVIDENSCFTYLNMSFSKMIEYSYNEILNTSIFNYLDKKNQRIVEEQLIKRRDGESQPYELMWTRKDGQKIYTIMAPKPLIDAEGNYIGSFAVITNITERITAEQKLKESEERYRNLIESVPFSIALIDQQGKIIYCNPATEKLLGYKREELLGYEFKNLPAINPRYVPILLKRFKKVLNGEILPPLEIELYKKDGSPIWIRYQSTLLKLGDIVLLQTVIND